MTALDAHRSFLDGQGRLAAQRDRQAEGWILAALLERFGRRGLARLSELGLDAGPVAGGQPFERLRALSLALETPR